MGTGPQPARNSDASAASVNDERRNVGLAQPGGAGTPALYLTAKEYMDRIREKEEGRKKEEEEKQILKLEREENKKRRAYEAELKNKEVAERKRIRAEKAQAKTKPRSRKLRAQRGLRTEPTHPQCDVAFSPPSSADPSHLS